MKIFLSAGEASGDIHGAALVEALEAKGVDEILFLGGDAMAEAAGCKPLIHYRQMAYMGFSEVIRHAPALLKNLSTARRTITRSRPDAVVLIDYPSFNLKLAAHARKLGIPVYYYIAPKVWAWKQWRIADLRRCCTRVLSILPFEVPFFSAKGLEVTYVGNPSVDEIDNRPAADRLSHDQVCRIAGFDAGTSYIALVPGSRLSEIRNNLPAMVEAASRFTAYRKVVTAAPGIDRSFYTQFGDITVVEGITQSAVENAVAALVTSGTATLETALLGTPQIVCYRGNGSKLTYNLMSKVLHCPFVSLPNLIADREIVPELLMHLCNVDNIATHLGMILPGGASRNAMLAGYADMRRALDAYPHVAPGQSAASKAASVIMESGK